MACPSRTRGYTLSSPLWNGRRSSAKRGTLVTSWSHLSHGRTQSDRRESCRAKPLLIFRLLSSLQVLATHAALRIERRRVRVLIMYIVQQRTDASIQGNISTQYNVDTYGGTETGKSSNTREQRCATTPKPQSNVQSSSVT